MTIGAEKLTSASDRVQPATSATRPQLVVFVLVLAVALLCPFYLKGFQVFQLNLMLVYAIAI